MDEIVETSDPEELEDLVRFKPQIRPSPRDGRQSPRKRPKLHHEYSDITPRKPPLSPSSSFHEAQSLRYRSTPERESPGSLTRASSSKASSPVATPPISVVDPSISPDVADHSEELSFMGGTQDPLLLGGTVSPKFHVAPQDGGSHSNPSSSPRLDYSDLGDAMVTEPSHESPPPQSRRSRSESVDPLLLFTPSRPSINDEAVVASTSKLKDAGIRASSLPLPGSPPSPLTPSPSPPPSQRPAPQPEETDRLSVTHPDDLGVSLALANRSRWSFRNRNPQQLKPYQFDQANYHITMRNLPEAIVKGPSLRHQHTREPDYEEDQTQEPGVDGNESENGSRTERRRHRPSKSKSPPAAEWMAAPLPSSEEEDGIDAVREEARNSTREQKKRANGKARRKMPKPFPLKPTDSSDESDHVPRKSPSRRSADRVHSPDPPTARVSQQPSRHSKSGSPAFPTGSRAPRAPTPVFQNAPSASSPVFFRDDSDVDMEMPSNFSPPPHSPRVERSNPGTPIVISDNESEGPAHKTAEESEPEELTKEEKKQRKRIRALNRMYPAFMRERMMKGAALAKAAPRRQRSVTVSSESDREEPLLPGQTRVRRAEHPRNLRDIKGDSESSDEPMAATKDAEDSDGGPAASDSDVQVVWPGRKSRAREDVWSSDEELLSDGRIDDERIEAYLQETRVRGSGLQEKDMIDWMLANTARIGGARRPSTRTKSTKVARSQGSSRPKISVKIGGARRERQTLLSFDKPSKRGQSRDRRRARSSGSNAIGAGSAPSESRKRAAVRQTVLIDSIIDNTRSASPPSRRDRYSYSSPERDSAPSFYREELPPSPAARNIPQETVHYIPDPAALRKAARKQKEKERQARIKMQGVHMFIAPKGTRIDGQRTKNKGVHINVADRGFHKALAPIKSDKPPRPPQPPRPPAPKIAHVPAHSAPRSSGVNAKRRLLPRGDRPHAPVPDDDSSIGDDEETGAQGREDGEDSIHSASVEEQEQTFLLDFGIPVVPNLTFTMQTWIGKFDLKQLVDPPPEAVRPSYFSAHGFDLGPNISTQEFLDILGNLCDRFFEFATGLPQADNGEQANEWSRLISVACQLVSFLPSGEELKATVATQVLRLTSSMRAASLTSTSMDLTTFTICWFAVELAVRANFLLPATPPRPKDPPNPLHEACAVLIEHLLEYGLERGMEPFTSEVVIDGSTVAHRALEMWVGLWHIGHKYRHSASTAVHPLWRLVQTTLQARQSLETSPLDASEQAWRAVISLSAVSQMSQFPNMSRYMGSSIIPPACWDMVVFALQQIGLEADEEVDKTMSDSALDNRDRYLKLVVERCCLLWSRWKWGLEDTSAAISQLIKIFQSRKFKNLRHEKPEFPDFLRLDDWTMLSSPIHSETAFVLLLKLVYQTLLVIPSRTKKFLSLLAPVGHLPWSKSQPPTAEELSQLYNRFTTFAIGIYLDPDGHAQWIQRARGYVQFKDVELTTRTAYIRGLMYLSSVMVQRYVQLDESLSWLDEMVTALLDEHRLRTKEHNKVVIGVHLLVGAVRHVIRVFNGSNPQRYPEPRLLLSIERILRDGSLVKPTNSSAHQVPRLIRSFLVARTLAVPEPRRPIIQNQESQDEYGALAFDQDIIAAFEEDDLPEYQVKDRSLCKLLDENITWTLFRQLVEELKHAGSKKLKKSFKDNNIFSTDIATLTGCWVGCGNIIVQNTPKTWAIFLHPYGRDHSTWPILDNFCQRRMDFLVFSNLLILDPMSYLTLQDTFLVVLFESIVSWHTTSEDDYIKLLLSIDGLQHPLFRGASWDPVLEKDGASNLDLLDARLPLLTAILENLGNCLDELGHPAEDNGRYVGYCIKMFSAMKNIHLELHKSQATQQSYANWCSKVYRECQNHPIIAGEDRLEQWMSWGESLNEIMQN